MANAPARGRNGTTLEEVASRAGVSRATVSRVVNGSPRVSADIRRDVEAAIAELGYVPNRAARSLVTRRSGSIGVVITEPTGRLFSDPFFPRLLRGISAALAARDLQLVLLMPASPADSQRTADYLAAGHVDGALLVSLHGDDPLPARIAAAGIPTVVVGRPLRASAASYVDVDNRGGARSAVDHLITGGRRVIATIAGPADMVAGDRPPRGLSRGRHRGRPRHRPDARGDRRLHPGRRRGGDGATPRRASRHRRGVRGVRPDGRRRDVRPRRRRATRPQDVAVVGYDDSPVASTARPQLTSVRQPIEEMGQRDWPAC